MAEQICRAIGWLKSQFEDPINAIPRILMMIHQEQKRHNKEVEALLKQIAEK